MTLPAPHTGLTQTQVEERRADAGWNELPEVKSVGPVRVFLRQFSSFLVLILIGAAIIAYIVGERVDTLAIGLVVVLNAALGFVQEWRAETALSTLRKMLSPQALVIRDGQEQMIPARDLVPGDLIVVNPGDKLPADATILAGPGLQIDESVLTGESHSVEKGVDERVFAGTLVVSGRVEAVVTETGVQTEFGQVALLTGAIETKKTALQRQLSRLATQLGIAAVAVAGLVVTLGLIMQRDPFEMFMTGLSLSVAMVPEGLPAVVTITLALGAAAMVRQKALARRLQAVETLGAASVICTDKTGTLTENKMTATQIWTPERIYDVTGAGYDPMGHIELDGQRVRAADDPVLAAALEAGLTCTHAKLRRAGSVWEMVGAPTEGALVTLGYKGWAPLPEPDAILAELPFSSDRKRMSVLVGGDTGSRLLTKGAPEKVLELCCAVNTSAGVIKLTEDVKKQIERAYDDMAARGLRVIALASRDVAGKEIIEADLTFLGLVGIIDPPREEVKAAIAATRSAGIRVVMITGDGPVTAQAIANQLDLPKSRILTGAELDDISDADLTNVLAGNVLFARTKPAHKIRIVEAFQAMGQIVAMTGDGVNDAPALKQADIGVAMGIRGTDVARDASDLVLLDDNFATIVRAIREGRRQFDNVQKFVRYLLSSNAGEVVALVANIMIGGPLIFLATQILWMNLVTDGVTAVALGLEKSEPGQMRRPPRLRNTAILGWRGVLTIGLLGLYTGSASLMIFLHFLEFGTDLARTAAFTGMVVFEKVSVFAFRSLRQPCWRLGWLSNRLLLLALAVTMGAQIAAIYWPPLQALLHTVPLGRDEWVMILGFAVPIIVVPELLKSFNRPE